MAAVMESPLLAVGDPNKKSWIEIELVDGKGKPVKHARYRVTPPGGKPVEGFLNDEGFARINGIDPGNCTIAFPDLDGATWKPASGDPGRLKKAEPEPRILPSIGPVTFTLVRGPGVPSIGPVKLTSFLGPPLPAIGDVVLTVIPGTPLPSIGPVTFSVLGSIVPPIPLMRPGIKLATVTLRIAGEPYIVPETVKLLISSKVPVIVPASVIIRLNPSTPVIVPASVTIRRNPSTPVIVPASVRMRITKTQSPPPTIKVASIFVRPTNKP